ncbi:MAG: hypothetical protein AAGA32_22760 [Pseudomonadota bacterium]
MLNKGFFFSAVLAATSAAHSDEASDGAALVRSALDRLLERHAPGLTPPTLEVRIKSRSAHGIEGHLAWTDPSGVEVVGPSVLASAVDAPLTDAGIERFAYTLLRTSPGPWLPAVNPD